MSVLGGISMHSDNDEKLNENIEYLDNNSEASVPEDIKEELEDNNDVEEMLDDENEVLENEETNSFKRAYDRAKTENKTFDKDYYANRQKDLDERVKQAKEEKYRSWKPDSKEDSPEGTKINKNFMDKAKDNYNLANARLSSARNKLENAKANMYKASHPGEALKDAAKSKAKDIGKKAASGTGKAVLKGVKGAGKGFMALLKSPAGPYILAGIGIVVVLFMLIFTFTLIMSPVGASASENGYHGYAYHDSKYAEDPITVFAADGETFTTTLEDYVASITKTYVDNISYPEFIKFYSVVFRTKVLAELEQNGDGTINGANYPLDSEVIVGGTVYKAVEETKGTRTRRGGTDTARFPPGMPRAGNGNSKGMSASMQNPATNRPNW